MLVAIGLGCTASILRLPPPPLLLESSYMSLDSIFCTYDPSVHLQINPTLAHYTIIAQREHAKLTCSADGMYELDDAIPLDV